MATDLPEATPPIDRTAEWDAAPIAKPAAAASSRSSGRTAAFADSGVLLDLQRVGRTVTRRLDDRLRPLGLTSGQYLVLASVDMADPPMLGMVAQGLGMDRTTLTANLKPMERSGLIEVGVDRQDRRARRLHLSERGRTILARAQPIWHQAEAEIVASFGTGRADELRATLATLLEG